MAIKLQNKLLLIFFVCLSSNLVFGQNSNDHALIISQNFDNATYSHKRQVNFLFTKSKNVIVRYNPLSLSLGGMMFFYQKFISSQIGSSCPYEISCSAFSKACIQKFGLIKGIALSADRLMRCTRLSSVDLKPSDINEENSHIIDHPSDYEHLKKSKPAN